MGDFDEAWSAVERWADHTVPQGVLATGGTVGTGGVVRSATGWAVTAERESVERSESRGRAA